MRDVARAVDPSTRDPENRAAAGRIKGVSGGKHCHSDSALSSRGTGRPKTVDDGTGHRPMIRLSAVALRAMEQDIGPRDLNLLRLLLRFRVATTDQLRRGLYLDRVSRHAGEVACWRALRRLQRERLIERMPRRIGGLTGGSAPAVWHLTGPGHRLALMTRGDRAETRRTARVRRSEPPALFTLRHRLALTEIFVRLSELRTTGRLDALRFEAEPTCWRRFLGPGGVGVTLKPDAWAQTAARGSEFERLWFLEVDMGTESRAAVRRKAGVYETYRRTGLEQAEWGVFPKVVWIVPDECRQRQLEELFGEGALAGGHGAAVLDRLVETVKK